jgi:hypothetical protein
MLISLLLLASAQSHKIDVRVEGDGYIRFVRDGRAVYAKAARLSVKDGQLVNAYGDTPMPKIPVNGDGSFEVDEEGFVYGHLAAGRRRVGRFVLAQFDDEQALLLREGVIVAANRPSRLGNAGEDGWGVIKLIENKPEPAPLGGASTGAAGALAAVNPPVHSARSAEGVSIQVAAHSEVAGDKILLGDIAEISADPATRAVLAAIDLGETPPFGAKRIIDRTRILGRMKAAGLDSSSYTVLVPQRAEVVRKGQKITATQFIERAQEALAAQPQVATTYESSDAFPDFIAPIGELELRAEAVSGVNSNSASVVIGVYVDGRRVNSRTIRLTASAPAVTIRSGSLVKVILSAGAAQVEISGTARSTAALGQQIQVEVRYGSPEVRTTHLGTVAGPGTVEVKL